MSYLGLSPSSADGSGIKDFESASILLRLLAPNSPPTSSLPLFLIDALVHQTYSLGEPIAPSLEGQCQQLSTSDSFASLSPPSVASEAGVAALCIVLEGQVRLLCHNAARGKDVTIA
ncbi:MAG: hypothetical protein F6K16_43155, partial [Symploca sp. SIO2B6]|nr:hypothetical protein [Symploca sp. SIO2B6]